MSHDTDKLIRQLSLVAFLMAERRALTARDVKGNVEGYSEMSDEAFARRFYSDRAELIALGVPLNSQRDEFTGEELYTLRSENYFLPKLELTDDELAALLTSLHLLEGKFAYAEPLRLALQNLALGRTGFDELSGETADRVKVSDPDYSPELAGRLSKLEAAISKQRTVKFSYWSPQWDRVSERSLNPYALRHDEGVWYVIGSDLGDEREKTFRVSRIRSDIRFATRRERDFRLPADFDVENHRRRSPWQVGELAGTARVAVSGDTAWWVKRTLGDAGTLEDGVFQTEYAALAPLASWVLRQNGRAVPLEPPELRGTVASALTLIRDRHAGEAPAIATEKPQLELPTADRPAPPVAPERFAVLQALLAHLLAACGEAREAELDADELAERFRIPREDLQEHLSLLNLVNFGGGCYTVYAELEGSLVTVDKELYGDVFRLAPRLTPLEARAIRLALDYVGPSIAADSHTTLDRVRRKLEETFGQFELAQSEPRDVEDDRPTDEEALIGTLSDGIEQHRLVELEYLKEGEETPTRRLVEPYQLMRELPYWRVHTWDRNAGDARTYRVDRMRSARLTDKSFEPREGFDPNYLRDPGIARVWYSPEVARWKLERGALPLADGAALGELGFKTEDWIVGEILHDRGEAVVLEPGELRKTVAARAAALLRELKVSRVRVGR